MSIHGLVGDVQAPAGQPVEHAPAGRPIERPTRFGVIDQVRSPSKIGGLLDDRNRSESLCLQRARHSRITSSSTAGSRRPAAVDIGDVRRPAHLDPHLPGGGG
jgi:hypothetical protein